MCNEYLKSIGIDYKVVVSVVKEYFKTRVYDDFTLPAGKYNSLKIELGEAKDIIGGALFSQVSAYQPVQSQ